MTLPTYNEAYAAAIDEPPFSNSEDSDAWIRANCGRCVHDRPARQGDYTNGCPLIVVAYSGKTPAEWLKQGQWDHDKYTCLMFRPEDDPGPDEPTPIPDPPGQDALFPREPFERPCRMLAGAEPAAVEA